MTSNAQYEALALDLIRRTEAAVGKVCRLAVDTGITFQVPDIVQAVEDDLPPGYPDARVPGAKTRRDMIAEAAQAILSGEMYEDEDGG